MRVVEARAALRRTTALAVLVGACVVVALMVGIDAYVFWGEALVASVLYATIGGFLAYRRPQEPIAWLLAAIGASAGLQLLAGAWAATHLNSHPWGRYVAVASSVLQAGVVLGLVQLILRFPSGRVHGRVWRGVSRTVTAGAVVQVTGFVLAQRRLEDFGGVDNPLGPVAGAGVAEALGGVAWLAASVLAIVSLILRFRRAEGRERQQYSWFVYAAVLTAVVLTVGDVVGVGDLGWLIGPASLAVGVGAAALFHGLYDIRTAVSRSLAFAAAGALLVVVHVALTGAFSSLVGASSTEARTVATAVVAVTFAPLFALVSRVLERALYGSRAAPYRLLSTLHHQVQAVTEPEAVLCSIAGTIGRGLRLPLVTIDIDDGQSASFGDSSAPGDMEEFSLTYQGRRIGRLAVRPRRGDALLGQRDRAVLEEVATQLASAAHAASLTDSLRASRARLVAAREEERRRIRRDLHDGLGPMLTGLGLKLDVVHNRVRTVDANAAATLAGLRAETGDAIESVRRLVYDLRPPALDDLGLVGAIQEQAKRLEGAWPCTNGAGRQASLAIRVEVPGELRPLPAATEVAAFGIVSEAMNNAVRHSGASSCLVRLVLEGSLQVEIADNGSGLPSDLRQGVGMSSMVERAAEVGGRCVIEGAPGGGTRVMAWLPSR